MDDDHDLLVRLDARVESLTLLIEQRLESVEANIAAGKVIASSQHADMRKDIDAAWRQLRKNTSRWDRATGIALGLAAASATLGGVAGAIVSAIEGG